VNEWQLALTDLLPAACGIFAARAGESQVPPSTVNKMNRCERKLKRKLERVLRFMGGVAWRDGLPSAAEAGFVFRGFGTVEAVP
jgi:hypothetical protein